VLAFAPTAPIRGQTKETGLDEETREKYMDLVDEVSQALEDLNAFVSDLAAVLPAVRTN
jgi:hypothetical protein